MSEMDLYDLLIGGVRKSIEHLEPGDSILVPPWARWWQYREW